MAATRGQTSHRFLRYKEPRREEELGAVPNVRTSPNQRPLRNVFKLPVGENNDSSGQSNMHRRLQNVLWLIRVQLVPARPGRKTWAHGGDQPYRPVARSDEQQKSNGYQRYRSDGR